MNSSALLLLLLLLLLMVLLVPFPTPVNQSQSNDDDDETQGSARRRGTKRDGADEKRKKEAVCREIRCLVQWGGEDEDLEQNTPHKKKNHNNHLTRETKVDEGATSPRVFYLLKAARMQLFVAYPCWRRTRRRRCEARLRFHIYIRAIHFKLHRKARERENWIGCGTTTMCCPCGRTCSALAAFYWFFQGRQFRPL